MTTPSPNGTVGKMLLAYSRNLSRDAHTQETSLIYARAFLTHSDATLTRAAVLDFLDAASIENSLNPLPRKKAAAPGTLQLMFRIIRRLFISNGEDWPFRKGEGPKVTERERRHVALAPELVLSTIEAAKDGTLDDQQSVFFALASVYGLRKMEIAAVRPEHLDLKNDTLYVAAAKGGMERYHLLPEEILPQIVVYDFNTVMNVRQMDYVWERIEKRLGFPDVDGLGWHAVRRSLTTLLWEKLPQPKIQRFLRWSAGESSDMSVRYHSIQMVGAGQSSFHVGDAELDADFEVFEQHPFLPMWRGDPSWAIVVPGQQKRRRRRGDPNQAKFEM